MDRQGLVEGYIRGDITRRTFVRRLTVTGISLAAALSYAELLRPATARAAAGEDDYYEKYYEDEQPPDVVTEAPTAITHAGATARAQIDPNLQATQVWFEYGEPGAARTGTGRVAAAGDGDRRVEIALGELRPSTSYVVRAVAENGSGRTVGADFAFQTSAAPAAAPVAAVAAVVTPPPAPDTRGATFRRVRPRATLKQVLKSGVLPVEVTTNEDASLELTATLRQQVSGVRAAATRTRKVTIATGRVRATGGKPATAKLKLKRAGRRALKNKRAATLQLEIRATDRARNRSLRRQSLRLK
jgi:hypothetical protein